PRPPPRGTAIHWSTSTRTGRKSSSTPNTCRPTDSIPAQRVIRRSPRCSPRRSKRVLGRKPKPDTEPRLPPHAGAVVESRDLYKTYVLGRVKVAALRGVNLRIDRGEIVAIVGPSGCGKTTLLHCLSGLEDFEQGQVLLEG